MVSIPAVDYPRSLRISGVATSLADTLYEARMKVLQGETGWTPYVELPRSTKRAYEEIAIRLLMGLTQPEDTHRAEDFLWDYATTIARSQIRSVPNAR